MVSHPRPQILTLRYHPWRVAQWCEHPMPRIKISGSAPICFCGSALSQVLGQALDAKVLRQTLRLRVSAKHRTGARLVALTGSQDGSRWINDREPMWVTLPRIRAFLARVLGRTPVCGDVVWVEVLP